MPISNLTFKLIKTLDRLIWRNEACGIKSSHLQATEQLLVGMPTKNTVTILPSPKTAIHRSLYVHYAYTELKTGHCVSETALYVLWCAILLLKWQQSSSYSLHYRHWSVYIHMTREAQVKTGMIWVMFWTENNVAEYREAQTATLHDNKCSSEIVCTFLGKVPRERRYNNAFVYFHQPLSDVWISYYEIYTKKETKWVESLVT